jgi:hypothetical protein
MLWLGAGNDSTIMQFIAVCKVDDCEGVGNVSAIDTGMEVPEVAACDGAGIDSATVIEKPDGPPSSVRTDAVQTA